ncbi:drug/metabolite transporter (DMT)-like permease [Microbacteriaceae bacterium MWH-Ta3]|nr:drug/metabolite transporter (DMT)-like permease [Microbacteriaceae bacterium MWH-Ta3]
MQQFRAYLPALLSALFWATNFAFSPAVLDAIGPIQLTGARWIISLVLLVPLAIILEKPTWGGIRAEWKLHIVQSLLGYAGYALLLYYALTTTSPVTAAVLVALNPASIAIAARYVLHERITTRGKIGIGISFIGAVVVVLGGGVVGQFSFGYGDAMLLMATVLWTVYSMFAPRIQTPPVTATATQAAMSSIIMLPVMGIDVALGNTAWVTMDTMDWIGVLWVGLIPSAAAYFLWNMSAETIGATRTGASINLIPVFTAVIVVLMGGTITLWQIVGGALVLAGVTLSNRR